MARAWSKLSRGISCTTAATRLTGTTAICRTGSTATPPQCAPPMFDGITKVPRTLGGVRSEEHTSELQSRLHLVCRLLLEKKKKTETYPSRSLQKHWTWSVGTYVTCVGQ